VDARRRFLMRIIFYVIRFNPIHPSIAIINAAVGRPWMNSRLKYNID